MKKLFFTLPLLAASLLAEVPLGKEMTSGSVTVAVSAAPWAMLAQSGLPVPAQNSEIITLLFLVRSADAEVTAFSVSATVLVDGQAVSIRGAADKKEDAQNAAIWLSIPAGQNITITSLKITELRPVSTAELN